MDGINVKAQDQVTTISSQECRRRAGQGGCFGVGLSQASVDRSWPDAVDNVVPGAGEPRLGIIILLLRGYLKRQSWGGIRMVE